MAGSIIITAANGSLAIPAVQHLLAKYPGYTAILTIRNDTDDDVNTKKLRATIAKHPGAKTSIHVLDLANLSAVHGFADSIIDKIQNGSLPPLVGVVCNAYYWNLAGPMEMTQDGYEKSFQTAAVSSSSPAMRTGRARNGLEKYPPAIPEDLELLVKPAADEKPDNLGRGFQRYAVSKLAIVTWMYSLNRHLEKVSHDSNLP
ncbi:MAG: hypothetical protein Q9228_003344 [Teloschistes exilis]